MIQIAMRNGLTQQEIMGERHDLFSGLCFADIHNHAMASGMAREDRLEEMSILAHWSMLPHVKKPPKPKDLFRKSDEPKRITIEDMRASNMSFGDLKKQGGN